MKNSIKNQLLFRIYGHGRGWAFSANDFTVYFNRNDIDVALFSLEKEGKICRIVHGFYYYPRYSKFLEKQIPPDIEQVTNAFARKFGWHILPSGNTILNSLGLSTQVVAKNIYLSDGPSRKYNIDGRILEFKHIATRDGSLRNNNSATVVQAIKAWGQDYIDDDFLEKLSKKYSLAQWNEIKKDTLMTTAWVNKCINKIIANMEQKQ